MIRACAVALLSVLLVPSEALAQAVPGGTIQGVVGASDPALLVGATVRAESDSVVVSTEPAADGSFTLADLAPGQYRVEVIDANNRRVASATVTIGPGGITQTLNLTARISGIGIGPVPDEPARFQRGAFGITPSVSLSSLGQETNVFNAPDALKQNSMAFGIIPRAVVTLESPRLRAGALARGNYLYFDKFADERSLSGLFDGRAELTLGRITPWVGGGVDGGRRRVNHEIDLRAQQLTTTLRLGVDVRIASRTTASVEGNRVETGFDPSEQFRTVNLQQQLNHRADSGAIEVRQGLNDLITAIARVGGRQYQFRFTPGRDAEAITGEGGVAISRTDLVALRATIGYIGFDHVGADVADYRGAVASLRSSFVLPTRTRLLFEGGRDVVYSYEPLFPYFISTSGTVALEHPVLTALTIRGRFSGEQMDHRPAATVVTGGYTEGYAFLGAGVGYSVLRDVEVGFDFGREERGSPFTGRDYAGYRFGASVTLGAGPMVGGSVRQ